MTEKHARSDDLLDLALSQGDATAALTPDLGRVATHVTECVACRVRLTRLRSADGFEDPSDSILDAIVADGPVLTDDARTFITSASRSEPEPGDVWRVGVDDAVLVWVRRIVSDSTVDVVPLAFDVEMADSESLLIPALSTALQVPLVALIPVRTQIHRDTFLNKLGVLYISESVEEIITAAREGRAHALAAVGTPIESSDDRRIEFRQLMGDLLGDLTPIVYTERLKGDRDRKLTLGEAARQRVESTTVSPTTGGPENTLNGPR